MLTIGRHAAAFIQHQSLIFFRPPLYLSIGEKRKRDRRGRKCSCTRITIAPLRSPRQQHSNGSHISTLDWLNGVQVSLTELKEQKQIVQPPSRPKYI
jgi:hypothetical protein